MNELKIEKKFPNVGEVTEKKGHKISTFDHASPWKNARTAFYWINFQYPLYHAHTDWEVLIVLNDCIVQKINGETKHLSVGDACLVGPKDKHALFFPNGIKNQFQGITFLFRDSYMQLLMGLYGDTLYDDITTGDAPLYFSLSPSFLDKCVSSLFNIQVLESQNSPQAELQCNLLVSNIILKFLEQRQTVSNIPQILRPFIQLLNSPLATSEQVKEAQQKLPYSYPQLTRIFKKYLNCTITQYINTVKLQYAKELICNTDMSLPEITNELHFESLSYFHKIFKKHFALFRKFF